MYATIPHGNTYVASDILLTLDCSGYICGCHLLHALCNHPFYKPLHPPGLWPSPFLSDLRRRKGEHLCRICGGNSNSDPGAVALVSSQSAPEHTVTIPQGNTDTASSILQTLDCSVNICGCHLLHSLCNHPFNKPLHPPGLRPSPFLSILWKRKGEHLYCICGGNSNADPGAVALVLSQNAPECTLQSLMAIRILQAVSS